MRALPLWGVLILAMVAASSAAIHGDTSQPSDLEAEVIRKQYQSNSVDHTVVQFFSKTCCPQGSEILLHVEGMMSQMPALHVVALEI